jgi:hypothetical protein
MTSAVAGNPDVNVSNLIGNEAEVSIDVNPTNPNNQVIVGHSPNLATMNTFFTLDGGQTWALVALGDADDRLTSNFRFDPTVAFDDDGNVYVAYGVRTAAVPSGTQTTIIVAKSTDGGQTYTQFTRAGTAPDNPRGSGLPGSDKWHLATGPDPLEPTQQNVYLALTANIDDPGGLDQRIVLIPSYDGGQSFVTSIIVNDGSLDGLNSTGNIFADPAVGPNGEIYVAWHSVNTGEVFMDVSLDGGLTFGTDKLVTTSGTGFMASIPAQPDRGIFVGPTIDVDRSGGPFNGRLYITYTDLGIVRPQLPDTDIFVQFSDNQGSTWSPRTLVNDDGGINSQFLPWLDVDQRTGNVGVVWYDARNDARNEKVEVFMGVSTDGGASFGPNIVVSDGQSDQSLNNPNRYIGNYLEYIGLACFDGTAYVVWADNSSNLAELDFFTDQVAKGGVLNQPPIADAGPDQTVPVGNLVTLDGSGSSDPDSGPGPLSFSWTQTAGPTITLIGATTATPSFTPTEVGSYTLSLVVNDGQADSAPDSVTITVQTPQEPIQSLIAQVQSLGLPKGLETSLVSKLEAALASLNRGNKKAAMNELQAFMNHVNAQSGKKITEQQAAELIAAAQQIIDSLQESP